MYIDKCIYIDAVYVCIYRPPDPAGLPKSHLTFDLKGATFNRKRITSGATLAAVGDALREGEAPQWCAFEQERSQLGFGLRGSGVRQW